MHTVDLLKLIFIAVGTFFGIYGVFAEPTTPAPVTQGGSPKRGWSALSKKARIALVSLIVGFLGTLITTLVSQREEQKREVQRAEQHKLEERNVQYNLKALDSLSSRLLLVQRATDQLVYPIDPVIVAFTVEYTLSELAPEALQEIKRFAEEQAGSWMWYPEVHWTLDSMLRDHPLINEHMFDYTFALFASSTQNINDLDKGEHIFKMGNHYFGECIHQVVQMDEEKLFIKLEYRPHFEKGVQALTYGTSASTLAGKQIYFFLGPSRRDIDHTGYTFRLVENTVRLESWHAGFKVSIPMDVSTQKYDKEHEYPYRYQVRMSTSPIEYIKPY